MREPPTTPVFFNPAASLNRDITVALTSATSGRTFCDSLAGVGARGVRVANEVKRKLHVAIVDFNPDSLRLARRNARVNGVTDRCAFVGEEANTFLYSRFRRTEKFDYVDVDPFGTPAPYLQAAFNAVSDGGVVSVTATDTAVLCGVHPTVALRRYWARPLNNCFGHETAIRILVNACRRYAASLDIGVMPVAAHSTKHYVRVYLRAQVGATEADSSLGAEGFVEVCRSCHNVVVSTEMLSRCPTCGGQTDAAGPLWVGPLSEEPVLSSVLRECGSLGFREAVRELERLPASDSFPPGGYSVEEVCSRLKVSSVSESEVAGALAARGFRSAPQPYERRGIKTDAGYADLEAAVKELGKRRSPG